MRGTCLPDALGEERPVEHVGLRGADEVFITSTAGGILPVTGIDQSPVSDGEPGPVSTRVKNLYWERHDQGWQGTPVDYD